MLRIRILPVPTLAISFLVLVAVPGMAEDSTTTLSSSGRSVLTYNAALVPSPDRKKSWLGRSGFVHPILTPSGRAVTEAFPIKQTHQHGLMFAWTSAHYKSQPVDFWNSEAKQGRVRHREVVEASDGRLIVNLDHIAENTSPQTVILDETWDVSVVPDSVDHVFDLELTQVNVTDTPLVIKEYHYGGLCIRGSDAWMTGATMLTSEGKHREDGNHTRPKWCAMFGKVDGEVCGIAVLDHPTNNGHPTPVRLHPSNPYFCLAPMVLGEFEISKTQPYHARFRIVTFDGVADPNRLDRQWQDYSESASRR